MTNASVLQKEGGIDDDIQLHRFIGILMELSHMDRLECEDLEKRLKAYVEKNDPDFMIFSASATKALLKSLRDSRKY